MKKSESLFYGVLFLLNFIWSSSASSEIYKSDEDRLTLDTLVEMRRKALTWLMSQRNEDFGWGSDTPHVILALSTALDGWPQKNDIEALLTAKQLEVELLAKLLRYSDESVPSNRINYFALALNAICRDPKDYYGHNLIGLIEKHTNDFDYSGYPESFGYSLSSLAICLGGSFLHRRHVHHLIKIANDETRLHPIESRALALLALVCSNKENEGIYGIIQESYRKLGLGQRSDGSFGNIHTTALVIQGLGMDPSFDSYWNRSLGIKKFTELQNLDGSFEDGIYGTSDGLITISMLLNGTGILDLKHRRCSRFNYDSIYYILHDMKDMTSPLPEYNTSNLDGMSEATDGDKTSLGPTPSYSLTSLDTRVELPFSSSHQILSTLVPRTIEPNSPPSSTSLPTIPTSPSPLLIKYWLWIGQDPKQSERHNLTMSVPMNTSFFHVMQRAAEIDPAFEFSSTVWPNGHYVHTISGHREQPVGYNYWLLYRLPKDPDPASPPPTAYVADKGVDDLFVQNGDIYLFWFKKI